eukprot:403346523
MVQSQQPLKDIYPITAVNDQERMKNKKIAGLENHDKGHNLPNQSPKRQEDSQNDLIFQYAIEESKVQFQIDQKKMKIDQDFNFRDAFNHQKATKFNKQQNSNKLNEQSQVFCPHQGLSSFERDQFVKSTIRIVREDEKSQTYIHPLKQQQTALQALMLSHENEMKKKIRMKVPVYREEVDQYQSVAKQLKDLNQKIQQIRQKNQIDMMKLAQIQKKL